MSSTTSSNGPRIGASPNAASQRSGLGMRLSVAAILTALNVRLRLLGTATYVITAIRMISNAANTIPTAQPPEPGTRLTSERHGQEPYAR